MRSFKHLSAPCKRGLCLALVGWTWSGEGRRISLHQEPAELFRIVNGETAKHLAEQPLYLPGLAEVLAEAVATDGGPRC